MPLALNAFEHFRFWDSRVTCSESRSAYIDFFKFQNALSGTTMPSRSRAKDSEDLEAGNV